METLMLPFSPRFIVLTICAVVTALLLGIGIVDHKVLDLVVIPIFIFGALTLLGVRDLTQKSHAVLRNYPISAHMRFLLEEIRPEMRQYFFESEKDGMPFSRDTRAVVYQRAKMVLDKRPFGTQEDVYREGYEWMHHSVAPKPHADEKFRVTIGGPDCAKPYSASVFNISAMSFGALSPNAVRALNAGAKKGGFAHDTGEGGVSPYHRENGGDLIWEIGSGYFGCRNRDGSFNPEEFARVATDDQIKMVELKISQGAKPGHGGVLPAAKVSEEISRIRGVAMGEDCISPAYSPGVFDAAGNDGLHRRDAAAVRRQAGRIQAVHRPSLGISGDLQGDAADRNLSRFHRGRRQRRRHRRRAAGIHGPSGHADARGRQFRP